MLSHSLNRRHWLRLAAVAGIPLLGPPSRAQDQARAPLTLGFSLYGMKSLQPAEALRACAAIGYDGVELALQPGWPTEPAKLDADARRTLRRQLEDNKLQLVGLMENLAEPAEPAAHRANLDRLKVAAELGHTLSPDRPPVIETILGGRPNQWDKVKGPLVERLHAWAKTAAAAKVVLAVKPHVGNALHQPDDARWLLRQVNSPHLKLAFDFSHFQLRGLDLKKTIAALAPESVFVHVKDARGTAEKFEFLLPGEGTTDYAAYFALLKDAGYRGPVVVEVSGQISNRAGYDAMAAARTCYRNLAPAMKKADVREN